MIKKFNEYTNESKIKIPSDKEGILMYKKTPNLDLDVFKPSKEGKYKVYMTSSDGKVTRHDKAHWNGSSFEPGESFGLTDDQITDFDNNVLESNIYNMIKNFNQFIGSLNESNIISNAKEVTEEEYDDMLGVLTPIYINSIDGEKVSGFAVSEPYSSKGYPTFTTFFKKGDKYYSFTKDNACKLKKDDGTEITFDNYEKQEWTRDNQAFTVK